MGNKEFEVVPAKDEVDLKYQVAKFKTELKAVDGIIIDISPVLGPNGCVAIVKYRAKRSIGKPLNKSLDILVKFGKTIWNYRKKEKWRESLKNLQQKINEIKKEKEKRKDAKYD